MSGKTYTEIVIRELQNSLTGVAEEELEAAADIIQPDKRIFCDGSGRSGLQIMGKMIGLVRTDCARHSRGRCAPDLQRLRRNSGHGSSCRKSKGTGCICPSYYGK